MKIELSGRNKTDAFSRRNHVDILLGIAAECSLVKSNAISVSSTGAMNSDGKPSTGSGVQSSGGREEPTATNLSLKGPGNSSPW